LRPGGTISGPTMMALADLALYVAILAQIGPVGLAVTTSLNYNFLRKPGQAALIGEAKLSSSASGWRSARSCCSRKARARWSATRRGLIRSPAER
jgi:acyl-coenzyme A thioesterase PaaI-like protein